MKTNVIVKSGVKINSQEDDGHKDNEKCLVIAESMESQLGFLYLVLFNDGQIPIVVSDFKIRILTNEKPFNKKLEAEQTMYLESLPSNLFNYYKETTDEKNQNKNKFKKEKQL
jgi:hypothetical protein